MPHPTIRKVLSRSMPMPAAAALLIVAPLGTARAPDALVFHRAVAVRPPLNTSVPQETDLFALACTSGASCVAGGQYKNKGGVFEPIVVSRSAGIWRRGVLLRLPANAAAQPFGEVNGIACISPGNCVAVGDYDYQGGVFKQQAFIAIQAHGRWSRAFVPALPANASTTIAAQLEGVSCLRTGFCEAIGDYVDTAGNLQAMTVTKPAGGHWRRNVELIAPLGAAPNPQAVGFAISCTAPGACVAVGVDHVGANELAMGAVEARGTWHRAVQLRLPPNATGTFARAAAITCTATGTCLGVGAYDPTTGGFRAMSFAEARGRFSRAVEVTAVPRRASAMPETSLNAISCVTHGPCVAAGFGRNKAGHFMAMYAVRSSGHWTAVFLTLPSNAMVGTGQNSDLAAAACVRTGRCTTVGFYVDRSGGDRADAASTG